QKFLFKIAFYKNINVKGQEYCLKLVDTAGQDEYSIFPHTYAMDIHGYCLVYSINNLKSFEVAKIIYDKLLDMTGKIQVPIILVGNKNDLHLERCVSYQDGKDLADFMKANFVEVSAKEHSAVTNLFQTLILSIEKHGLSENNETSNQERHNKCTIA
ncbi:GTP-binding protein Rheb-like protein, partial [Sarcoptes scabiei]